VEVALMVVLVPASDPEPSLHPATITELARLGVTTLDLVRDEQNLALLLEGWAFDPNRSADAVLAALGCSRSRARTLQPLLHVAVSAGAETGQILENSHFDEGGRKCAG
jgi:hypothetical protein